jgi:hypothetical protein
MSRGTVASIGGKLGRAMSMRPHRVVTRIAPDRLVTVENL